LIPASTEICNDIILIALFHDISSLAVNMSLAQYLPILHLTMVLGQRMQLSSCHWSSSRTFLSCQSEAN